MTESREQTPSDNMPANAPKPEKSNRSLLYAFIVVFFGITAVTLSQQQAIGLIPIKNLLKNELHADRAATAAFFFWLGLAWYFKPFFGIFTDAFPFLGTRRKSYIVTGAILSVAGFIALIYTPHRYAPLLAVCIAINVFMVITSTAVGGFMTEKAQAFKRLRAVRVRLSSRVSDGRGRRRARWAEFWPPWPSDGRARPARQSWSCPYRPPFSSSKKNA